jgi:hypothetical protein
MTHRSHDKISDLPHNTPKHSGAAIDENHIKQRLTQVHRSYDTWATSPSCTWFPRWLWGCCRCNSKNMYDPAWHVMIATCPSSLQHDLITQKLSSPIYKPQTTYSRYLKHESVELATHPNTQGLPSAFKTLLWKTTLCKYIVFTICFTMDQSAIRLTYLHGHRHRHYLNTKYRFNKWIASFSR